MAVNEKDALLQQDAPDLKKRTENNVPHQPPTCQDNPHWLRELRLLYGVKATEMVEVIRAVYPAYDKALHSKCEQPEKYGITLSTEAKQLLIQHFCQSSTEE